MATKKASTKTGAKGAAGLAAKATTAKKISAKKVTSNTAAAKTATAKTPAAKLAAAKKLSAQKPSATKPTSKKPAAKKITAKNAVAKKPSATDKPARGVEAKTPPKKLKDAGNKTVKTKEAVDAFLARVAPDQLDDTNALIAMMGRITGEPPEMWGSSIVGFGHRTLTYETGRTMDWMHVAFSPRKQSMVLYILDGFPSYAGLLAKLGKHSTGKSCLYIKRLADINIDVLQQLITQSVKQVQKGGK
jgi:hypothetical protein